MSIPPYSTSGHRQVDDRQTWTADLVTEADFLLGPNTVKPSAREFVHGGGVEVLEPRVMQVLVALARQVGQVVSRDQLIEQCWAGRVVGEDAIQRCVTKIRKLSETFGGFELHTIARVGYRLTSVEPVTPLPLQSKTSKDEIAGTKSRKRYIAVAAVVICVAAALAFGVAKWQGDRYEQARIEQMLIKVEELVSKDSFGAAFTTAYSFSQNERIRSDPRFAKLWAKIVVRVRPLVSEPGAMIYFKPYEDTGEWIFAGTSPIKTWIEAPRTTLRVRVEKPGFRTGLFTIAVPGPSVEFEMPSILGPLAPFIPIPLPLTVVNTIPDDMVLVPRTDVPVYLWGWTPELFGSQRYDIPAFAIGKYEVSNREFKEFVDAGGYGDERFWSGLKFAEHGRPLSWTEARARFVDSTQRPGPAEWKMSAYPREQGDFPVSGISWYEAVAYARYRGKTLPTIHHWLRAGFSPLSGVFYTAPAMAADSNFETNGPVSARSEKGLGPWGTYHMLGNVREWVANFAGSDAVALGASWLTRGPESVAIYVADPMARAPDHGFRLMQSLDESPNSPLQSQLQAPITLVRDTDIIKRDPVSDEAFKAMRFQFSTARLAPIEIEKQEVQRSEMYVVEKVTLKYANDDPLTLHIVWPAAKSSHRLQAVVFGPGGNCCFARRDNQDNLENLREVEFVPNSGRVLVMPIWAGSYERFRPLPSDRDQQWDGSRQLALAWHRDLSATINYLESLKEIDDRKLGFIGYSRGASFMSLTLAIEPRVKAAVLVSAGVDVHRQLHPMYDLVNYAPRITIPLLMMNGRYDHTNPNETSQKRLFDLLGTRAEDKRRMTFEFGHFSYGSNAVAAETSNWFDRYLGPVR